MALTPEEILRYHRHLLLPEVGSEGQEKLKKAKVLVVGCGGLGSPVSLYLSAAGVGTLGLVDHDEVDLTNLQRQLVFGSNDAGRAKVEASIERLKTLNPLVEFRPHPVKLSSRNVMEIFKDYDVVIDASDNFPTRYLINDACVLLKKPNVYGSVRRFEGQASVFWAPRGPCYRCLFPEPPGPGSVPSCAEEGVLGVVPGVIGLVQATEAIKLILGQGDLLVGRYLLYNALEMRFREVKLPKDPDCPVCGTHPTIKAPSDEVQVCEPGLAGIVPEMTAQELKALMDEKKEFVLVDVREPQEHAASEIPGSRLIPLGEIDRRSNELDPAKLIVVHCRSGNRSARAIKILQGKGFGNLRNLKGGILAWLKEVDSKKGTLSRPSR
jgi:sulfur-carrier protein adenylyltransferase/sulfurtransferase